MTSALPRTSSVPPSTKRGKRSCVQGRKLVPCMRSTLGPRGVVDPSRHRIHLLLQHAILACASLWPGVHSPAGVLLNSTIIRCHGIKIEIQKCGCLFY
jgi:hypothetical protein